MTQLIQTIQNETKRSLTPHERVALMLTDSIAQFHGTVPLHIISGPDRYHIHVRETRGFPGLSYAVVDGTVHRSDRTGQDERFWDSYEQYLRGPGNIS
jgi:hypothetical protein